MNFTNLIVIIAASLILGVVILVFIFWKQLQKVEKLFGIKVPKGYIPIKTSFKKDFGLCIMVNPLIWHFLLLTYIYDPSITSAAHHDKTFDFYTAKMTELFADASSDIYFEAKDPVTLNKKLFPFYNISIQGEDPLEGHALLFSLKADMLLGFSSLANKGTFNPQEFQKILHQLNNLIPESC